MSASIANACSAPEARNYSRDATADIVFGWYYQYSALPMKLMVNTISESTAQLVADAIENPRKGKDLFKHIFTNNMYAVLVLILASMAAFFLIILLVFACFFKMHAGSRNMPTDRSIYCAIVGFAYCLLMAVFSAAIFSSSSIKVYHGITQLPAQMNRSSQDIANFVLAFGDNLYCNFNNDEVQLRNQTKGMIKNMQNFTYLLTRRLDTSLITQVFEKEKQIKAKLAALDRFVASQGSQGNNAALVRVRNAIQAINTVLTSSFPRVGPDLKSTRKSMDLLRNDIEKSINETEVHQKAVVAELSLYKKMFEEIVKQINVETEKFRSTGYRLMNEHDYVGAVAYYMPLTILLPFSLILLSLIGLSFLIVRCLANCCSDSSTEDYPMRGLPSRIGANVLGCGGYFAMLIGSTLFLLTAACFVFAFVSMFLCVNLFEDKELRVLYALPSKEFTSRTITRNLSITLHDTLYKCKNNFTFFDAIEGDQIWARQELEKKLSALRRTSYRRKIRNFHSNETLSNSINTLLQQLNESHLNFTKAIDALKVAGFNRATTLSKCEAEGDNTRSFLELVEKLHNMLIVVNSRSHRDKLARDVHIQMIKLEEAIVSRVASFLRAINDLSPQCDAIMSIWNDVGYYTCNSIALPAQGLWIACLIAALGSLTIYSALFEATTFLKSYAEYSSEGVNSNSRSSRSTKSRREPISSVHGQPLLKQGRKTKKTQNARIRKSKKHKTQRKKQSKNRSTQSKRSRPTLRKKQSKNKSSHSIRTASKTQPKFAVRREVVKRKTGRTSTENLENKLGSLTNVGIEEMKQAKNAGDVGSKNHVGVEARINFQETVPKITEDIKDNELGSAGVLKSRSTQDSHSKSLNDEKHNNTESMDQAKNEEISADKDPNIISTSNLINRKEDDNKSREDLHNLAITKAHPESGGDFINLNNVKEGHAEVHEGEIKDGGYHINNLNEDTKL